MTKLSAHHDRRVSRSYILMTFPYGCQGGTLYETGKKLKEAGAASVNAFVSHAVFPKESWKRFNVGGDRACFDKFWVTNSIPTVTDNLPVEDGVFEILDLMDLIIKDLDHFSSA